ncbi:MAG: carbamoyltransferase C-terminal domain-containing protein [Bacteroidota bacterium]
MNILGINFGHDAAATLIQNNRIIQSIEEEKISRIKQDFGWPTNAIDIILKQNSLTEQDIDVIAVGGIIFKEIGTNEIKFRFNKNRGTKQLEYIDRVLSYIGLSGDRFTEKNKDAFIAEVKKLGYTKAEVRFYNHHLCHAAGAYYCAPFTPDLVITCDGQGDGESFNFYTSEQGHLEPLVINGHEVSVGAFYSTITQLLGFRPTRHEGKITGLAAYGKPSVLEDQFYNLFKFENGKLQRFPFNKLDYYWKEFNMDERLKLIDKVNLTTSESSIGTEYTKRYEVLKAQIENLTKGWSKEDVAYACQKVSERIVIEETQRVLDQHFKNKKVKIGLAGGVFANVRINQVIYELPAVSNLFIQPAMGDSGLAIGAAILADIEKNGTSKLGNYQFTDTYIGPDYTNEVDSFLNSIANECEIELMENAPVKIAEMLRDNYVIGFWQGSMEWGPRALGKRSMILNTFDRTVNDSVNKRLSRTEFMPFAPSIIDYMMKTYIPNYDESCPAADYMTITYDVKKDFHELLQAVVHVDGTARPQSVSKKTNPYYYDIIDEFYKLTGCGAIVNTSFNAHEEPIVSTPQSAYKALKEDRIDVLVLDRYLIKYNKN